MKTFLKCRIKKKSRCKLYCNGQTAFLKVLKQHNVFFFMDICVVKIEKHGLEEPPHIHDGGASGREEKGTGDGERVALVFSVMTCLFGEGRAKVTKC